MSHGHNGGCNGGSVVNDNGGAPPNFLYSITVTGQDAEIDELTTQVDVCGTEPVTLTLPCGPRFARAPLVINNRSTAVVTITSPDRSIEGEDADGNIFLQPGQSALLTFGRCDDNDGKCGSWSVLLGVADGDDDCDTICVPNIAALAALPAELEDQQRVKVATLDGFWEKDVSSTATPDGITVVAALGGGNWLRLFAHSAKWTNQNTYFIDPVATGGVGNDENLGNTAAVPLNTLAEVWRRLQRFNITTISTPQVYAYVITLMRAIPDTDSYRPSGQIAEQDTNGNVFSFVLRGTRTPAPINGVVGGPLTGTTGTLSFNTNNTNAAIGAGANTQAQFDGGVGFVPAANLGKLVVIDTGGPLPVLAWITRDNGGTLAQVSEFVTVDSQPTTSVITLQGAAGTAPFATTGFPYQIVDLTSFGPDLSTVGSPIIRHRFENIDFVPLTTSVSGLSFRSVAFEFITSRIQRQPNWIGATGDCRACGIDFPSLATFAVADGSTNALIACGLRNVEVAAFSSGSLNLADTHVEAGFARTGLLFQAIPSFGGTTNPANLVLGSIRVTGTRGFGAFRAPAGRSGVIGRRFGTFDIIGTLYGQGNAVAGADISQGATMGVLSTTTPIITGAVQEVLIDSPDTVGAPAAPGAIIPSIDPLTGLPVAGVAITTWATWAGATYDRSVMNLKNGSRIVNMTNP